MLPCLDEAAALPWVLARIPAGWRAIVVDNGSTDGSADVARSLGATVVHEPRRGFGAACHAGLLAADADVVCFCDCDASLDPALLTPFVRAVADGRARSGAGPPPPRRAAAPGRRTPGSAISRWPGCCAAAPDCGCTTSARCAPRGAPTCSASDLTDRRSGYPLQMVVRAADAGWRVEERDGALPAAHRPLQGHRHLARHLARGTRHARGPREQPLPAPGRTERRVPSERRAGAPGAPAARHHAPGHRQGAGARPGQDPAHPAVHPRARPPSWPRPRSSTPCTAARAMPARRRVLVLDGAPGELAAGRLRRGRPQCAGGLDERLAAAFAGCTGPTLLIGMDTPQVTPRLLAPALGPDAWGDCDAWFGRGRRRRVLGARPGRARPPSCCAACRCPPAAHGRGPARSADRCRAAGAGPAGPAGRRHRRRCRRVAAAAPDGRFAADPRPPDAGHRPMSTAMTAHGATDRHGTVAWGADPYADALRNGRGPLFLRRADGWLLPLEVERWCAAPTPPICRRCAAARAPSSTSAAAPAGWSPRSPRPGTRALGIDVSAAAVARTVGGRRRRAAAVPSSTPCPARAVGAPPCSSTATSASAATRAPC